PLLSPRSALRLPGGSCCRAAGATRSRQGHPRLRIGRNGGQLADRLSRRVCFFRRLKFARCHCLSGTHTHTPTRHVTHTDPGNAEKRAKMRRTLVY
ncbi:hypothetical protein CORC01_09798, partial [Colletotrichum orchidophilum]